MQAPIILSIVTCPVYCHFSVLYYLRRRGHAFTGKVTFLLLAGLRKNHSTDLHEIWWKGGHLGR